MRTLAIALVLLLAEMVFLVWDPVLPPESVPGVLTLTQGEFVRSDAAEPPREGWEPVTLPDSWRKRRPDASGLAWYRVEFMLAALPAEPLALYLPRLAVAGEIRLNGALLNARLRDEQPEGREVQYVDAPLYFVLPSTAFQPGRNELLVRMLGDQDMRSGLSAPRLGPVPVMAAMLAPQRLLGTAMPYALVILMLSAMALACAYAYRRKQYAGIQITLALGAVSLALDLIPDLPLSRGDRYAVRAVVFAAMVWLLCLAAYRLSAVRKRHLPRVIHLVSLAVMLASAATIVQGTASDKVWLYATPFYPLVAYVLALVLETAWLQRSMRLGLLVGVAVIWMAAVLHSNMLPFGWLPWDSFRYNTAAAVPLCAMLVLVLAERFVQDREEAVRNHRAAVGTERARILQDMHDGMGAQLITAKRLALREEVDRKELARVIDESLQDLRLIIDSLDVAEGDVLPLLGNLRFRLAPRLAALGIHLGWHAEAVPPLAGLNATGALSILRIVQEPINNALKHARPTHLHIEIVAEGKGLCIQVRDDGQGFEAGQREAGQPNAGRGLAGMRLRAQRLGASLSVDSEAGKGTRVTLRVPPQLDGA